MAATHNFFFFGQDPNVLGVILGSVLGFLAGAIVVCVGYFVYTKRSGTYSPLSRDVRAKIDYYSASNPDGAFLAAQTRPVQVQPNVYTLAKSSAESYPEITELNNGDHRRIRVTRPYEAGAIATIPEDSEDVEDGSPRSLERNGSTGSDKPKLSKRMSLPTTLKSDGLFNPNPEEFLKKKFSSEEEECRLEFSCFYDTASRELHITVIQVVGISTPNESFLRPPSCSVKMRILPEMLSWQWTRRISRTSNPAFNETFIVPGFVHNKLRECTVHFVVLDFDHVQDTVYVIGEVIMPLSELRANRLEKIIKRVNPLAF